MVVSDVFTVESGTAITEEQVYSMQGDLPCLTCQIQDNGITFLVDKKIITEKKDAEGNRFYKNKIYNYPCITWTKNGNAGYMTYRNMDFICTPDCGVLSLKDKYKDELSLTWFVNRYQAVFLENVTSKNSQGKLNETVTANIPIDYPFPPMAEQLDYVEKVRKLNRYKEICDTEIAKINEIMSGVVSVPKHENYQGVDIAVSEIFDCTSGNSGLTEEFIYNHQHDTGEKCKVLSSSTDKATSMGYISENVVLNDKPIKVFNGEGILIARNGDAGSMVYLTDGKYAMNDHAYILSIKDKCKYDINLQWFTYTQGDLIKEYATGEGNATWNKSGFFESAKLDIPSRSYQDAIVVQYSKLQRERERVIHIQSLCL